MYQLNTMDPNGYNLTEGGNNGIPCETARQNNSEAHKRAYQDPVILKRHSEGQRRRFQRPEERQKVIDFMTGREMPPEVRKRRSEAHRRSIGVC